mmetsp:Transcript_14738/g.43234  ORF Transcript_14738/g.43234 Transcript_14738/m.43234 type:complete len:258 (+) Transcript_14738:633-1406(+)
MRPQEPQSGRRPLCSTRTSPPRRVSRSLQPRMSSWTTCSPWTRTTCVTVTPELPSAQAQLLRAALTAGVRTSTSRGQSSRSTSTDYVRLRSWNCLQNTTKGLRRCFRQPWRVGYARLGRSPGRTQREPRRRRASSPSMASWQVVSRGSTASNSTSTRRTRPWRTQWPRCGAWIACCARRAPSCAGCASGAASWLKPGTSTRKRNAHCSRARPPSHPARPRRGWWIPFLPARRAFLATAIALLLRPLPTAHNSQRSQG